MKRSNFARLWWQRTKHTFTDDVGNPEQIAQEYDVPVQDVQAAIAFLSENPPDRVRNFIFLVEQLM